MPLLLIVLLVAFLTLFLYWQLIWAEGTYLGKGVVAWLYDVFASRYNHIKQYTLEDDARYLGAPIALSLQGSPQPCVLDVATGTSRLPLILCQQPLFHGDLIALDNARRMLHEATQYVRDYQDRVTWVWHHAAPLPFDDNTFDAVTCLEAFEFMPSTRAAVQECVRVLKPGGLLCVTNRAGSGRWQIPGKTFSREKFEALLGALGQHDVTTQVWQIDYDLVWSIKPEAVPAAIEFSGPRQPIDLLRCPKCRQPIAPAAGALTCRACGRRYPIGPDGVIELL